MAGPQEKALGNAVHWKARSFGAIAQAARGRDASSLHYVLIVKTRASYQAGITGRNGQENSGFIKKKLYILIKEDN